MKTDADTDPNVQLRFVGRLQALEDGIKAALAQCSHHDLYTLDLLPIARDVMHRAVLRTWTASGSVETKRAEST